MTATKVKKRYKKYSIIQITKTKLNAKFFLDKNSIVTLDDVVELTGLDGSEIIQLNLVKIKEPRRKRK